MAMDFIGFGEMADEPYITAKGKTNSVFVQQHDVAVVLFVQK